MSSQRVGKNVTHPLDLNVLNFPPFPLFVPTLHMNILRPFAGVLTLAFLITALTSCGPAPTPQVQEQKLYEWHDDGGPGKVSVRINLATQRAFFTRGDRPIGWTYVATGKPGHSTPTGSFRITEKVIDKHSNAYGWIEDELGNVVNGDAKPSTPVPAGCTYMPAPMPYWMRLTNWGIGMHAGLIPNPGTTASHGCIRLPKPFAPILFSAVEVGTPVKIENVPTAPAAPDLTSAPATATPPPYPIRPSFPNPTLP
ncbi:MAG: L,D-transpeptidase, partial [Verrucomicrobiales bacterium]